MYNVKVKDASQLDSWGWNSRSVSAIKCENFPKTTDKSHTKWRSSLVLRKELFLVESKLSLLFYPKTNLFPISNPVAQFYSFLWQEVLYLWVFVVYHEMTLIDALELRPRLLPLISTSNFYLKQYHNRNEKEYDRPLFLIVLMESISTLGLQKIIKRCPQWTCGVCEGIALVFISHWAHIRCPEVFTFNFQDLIVNSPLTSGCYSFSCKLVMRIWC